MIGYGLGSQYGVLLPFSRAHEAEADRIGLSLMAMAGYDPEEAIGFWERMSKNSGKRGRKMEFASTHPADRTRLANLETYMAEAKSRYIPRKEEPEDTFGRKSAKTPQKPWTDESRDKKRDERVEPRKRSRERVEPRNRRSRDRVEPRNRGRDRVEPRNKSRDRYYRDEDFR
jgi:predicted Zn-dependent protease